MVIQKACLMRMFFCAWKLKLEIEQFVFDQQVLGKMSTTANGSSGRSTSSGPSGNVKIDDFIKLEKIGEGTYGVVFKGKNKKSGEIVILLRLSSRYITVGMQWGSEN